MISIPDAKRSRLGPQFGPFDLHSQQFNVVSVRDLLNAAGRESREFGDGPTKGLGPTKAPIFDCVLGNKVADLLVCAVADHERDTNRREVSHQVIWVAARPQQAKPPRVHRRAEILDFKRQTQLERAVVLALTGKTIEEILQWHEGNEAAACRKTCELGNREPCLGELCIDVERALVRQRQELVQPA